MKRVWRLLAVLSFLFLSFSRIGFTWGIVGHATLARACVPFLPPALQSLYEPHLDKIAYYSAAPDMIWKTDQTARNLERPVHFLNSESFTVSPINNDHFPVDPLEAGKLFQDPKGRILKDTGTLPWRTAQIQNMLTDAFEKAKKTGSNKEIGYLSGILAHYVGDAAQPLHVTVNYDGADTNQQGIHSFFETKVVQELITDGSLTPESIVAAGRLKEKKWKAALHADPVRTSLRQLSESFQHIGPLLDLDRQYAVKAGSFVLMPDGMRLADRKPVVDVAPHFKGLVTERLAHGSVTLAAMIEQAWVKAGKPALKSVFGALVKKPAYILPLF